MSARIARPLHPLAWWIWAIGLAVAASRTTNPLLLGLILGSVGFVVSARRADAPWARGFHYYLGLALVVVAIRVVLRAVFGGDIGAHEQVLFRLPRVPLPSWLAGVQLGGPVTLPGTLAALTDGLRLGVLLCCIGAANALANPKRALRVLPGALYELGVAVVVAITIAPQLVESTQRVRRARRLRGGSGSGRRALRAIAIPVLEDALERSLLLAAAMDSRGYGRVGSAGTRRRRITAALLVGGLLALCVGSYGLLDPSTPSYLGLPAMGVGVGLCTAGLGTGGRRVSRTRYRPDPWRWPEWSVVICGLVPAVLLAGGWGLSATALDPVFSPPHWPTLPVWGAVAVLVPLLAGVLAPPRPATSASVAPPAALTDQPAARRETVAA